MIKVPVYNTSGEQIKEMELNPAMFGVTVKPEVVAQAIIVQQANARIVVAHTKDRSEVRGGGRKPWRQKGTGRARHGSRRSPIWRGGGITFGPNNDRNFSLKINKKAKRKALAMALSDKVASQKLVLVDSLQVSEAKTKKFVEILKNLKLRPKTGKAAVSKDTKAVVKADAIKKTRPVSVLVVMAKKDSSIVRAARNVVRVKTILADSLNIVDVVKHQFILMPADAISVIEKTFVK